MFFRMRPVLILLALGLVACTKRHPAPGDAPSGSASVQVVPPSPHVGPLGTPTAFELTVTSSGATLVWAPRQRTDGALKRVDLDATGAFRGPALPALESGAVTGEVSDLAATWVKERLALAWIERQGPKARVRAAWAATGAPPFELGDAWSGPRNARGNLVVAARDDRALVFARGDEAPCIEPGRHGCFAFGFHELGPAGAEKTGLPMSVPVPCANDSAQLAVVGDRFHYGVCTDTGSRPVTTMFTIERHPEYARADPLLEDCTPVGTFVWQGAAWLVADCDGSRRAARMGPRDEPAQFLDLHARRLDCHAGIASLRAPSLDFPLEEPRSGLVALLPPEIAPSGARAAWAGRALLVATALGDRVHLVRSVCNGDKLETTMLDVE